MGLFDRNRGRGGGSAMQLPPDFARKLEEFGRWEFDPPGSAGPPEVGEYELYTLAQPDPEAFIRAVAAVAIPAGGWAVYGGARAVWHAIGTGVEDPDYLRMLDAAIEFVLSQGYGTVGLAPFELARLAETHAS